LLDLLGDFQVTLEPATLLGLIKQQLPLDRHADLHGQGVGQRFVARAEAPASLVERREYTDRLVEPVTDGDGEQAPGPVAGPAVDLGVESRVEVCVFEPDRLAIAEDSPGDPAIGREPETRRTRHRATRQLVGRPIEDEDARAIAVEDPEDRRLHQFEQRLKLRRRRELPGNLENAHQVGRRRPERGITLTLRRSVHRSTPAAVGWARPTSRSQGVSRI
jgi:hypothetical protein